MIQSYGGKLATTRVVGAELWIIQRDDLPAIVNGVAKEDGFGFLVVNVDASLAKMLVRGLAGSRMEQAVLYS